MNLLEIHGHLQKLPILVTTLTAGLVYLTTTLSAPLAAAPPSLSTSLSLFPLSAPVLRDQARRWCCEIRRDGGAARSDKMMLRDRTKLLRDQTRGCCEIGRDDAARSDEMLLLRDQVRRWCCEIEQDGDATNGEEGATATVVHVACDGGATLRLQSSSAQRVAEEAAQPTIVGGSNITETVACKQARRKFDCFQIENYFFNWNRKHWNLRVD